MATSPDFFDRLTEQWEEEIRDAFLEAVREITDRVVIKDLAAAIQRGDIDLALRLVGLDPLDFRSLDYLISEVFRQGGEAAALEIPASRAANGAVSRFLFNVRNPRAEAWARERSSRLVTQIVDDQRMTIRQSIAAGLEAGVNPRTSALELVGRINRTSNRREGGVIGLTARQEESQRRYAAQLASGDPAEMRAALTRALRDKRFDRSVEKAIRNGEPVPADIRAKMVMAYRNRTLRYRAEVIARTETIQSLGAAQVEAWQQAIDKGDVDQRTIVKIPVSAKDERVRNNHRAVEILNKDGVPWGQPYKVPLGMAPQMHAPYDEPMCRCRERIKVDRFRGLR
jgi:uncharacterized protein YajQ (UPF0234 family)